MDGRSDNGAAAPRAATRRQALAALAALAGPGWVGSARAQAPAPTDTAVRPVQVAPDVWFVQGHSALGSSANRNFISNAGFVVTPEGVLVVDALGSPALADELIAAIRRITSQPIRYVVVTHFHADHIYGLQSFKAAGATIVAHPAGREYLASDTARLRLEASRQELAPWVDERTRLLGADDWLAADEGVLRLGGVEFRLRHAGPAHTPEDLMLFEPRSGVLFAGDLVFRGRVPFVGQADSRRWIESLSRVMEFRPRLLVPGHGPVSDRAQEDLALTRDYLLYLRQTMGEAARNMEPFEDAYARTDWSRFDGLPLFRVANRMNAYNTYLLMEHQQP